MIDRVLDAKQRLSSVSNDGRGLKLAAVFNAAGTMPTFVRQQ